LNVELIHAAYTLSMHALLSARDWPEQLSHFL